MDLYLSKIKVHKQFQINILINKLKTTTIFEQVFFYHPVVPLPPPQKEKMGVGVLFGDFILFVNKVIKCGNKDNKIAKVINLVTKFLNLVTKLLNLVLKLSNLVTHF